jgi:hypothetical protein
LLLFFELFVDHGDGVEDEFGEGLLFLGVELGHFLYFELEEVEAVFDVLDVAQL